MLRLFLSIITACYTLAEPHTRGSIRYGRLNSGIHPASSLSANSDSYYYDYEDWADSNYITKISKAIGIEFETNYKDLPESGFLDTIPFPANWWPTHKDSINNDWSGTGAPSVKYARAFGLNVRQMTNSISMRNGIMGVNGNRCDSDYYCAHGSTCAFRGWYDEGKCISSWWGLCHSWAPAALLEPEPRCAIVKNGVTFYVQDLKALLIWLYDADSVETVFTGDRCNGSHELDKYGRYSDPACRDTTASFFHLVVTNLLGIHKRGFVVDIDTGNQVWNHPTYGYEITKMRKIPESAATRMFRNSYGDYWPFNEDATQFLHVKMSFYYVEANLRDGALVSTGIAEEENVGTKYYEYVLELNDHGDIIGGEWIRKSMADHPDFVWFMLSRPSPSFTTEEGISYEKVSQMVKDSLTNCS